MLTHVILADGTTLVCRRRPAVVRLLLALVGSVRLRRAWTPDAAESDAADITVWRGSVLALTRVPTPEQEG